MGRKTCNETNTKRKQLKWTPWFNMEKLEIRKKKTMKSNHIKKLIMKIEKNCTKFLFSHSFIVFIHFSLPSTPKTYKEMYFNTPKDAILHGNMNNKKENCPTWFEILWCWGLDCRGAPLSISTSTLQRRGNATYSAASLCYLFPIALCSLSLTRDCSAALLDYTMS